MLKSLPAEIASVLRSRRGRTNLRVLVRFFIVLTVLITTYTIGFHLLMLREGQDYTWITGLYWTLTVMSTLGFGDITFHTDIGRLFSILVLLSGMIFLLILLPFTFIEFFYEPWMSAQEAARAPRELPPETNNHVLITNYDAVTGALIPRLEQYQYTYAILTSEVDDALRMHDAGLNTMVGNLDDPETWARARADHSALVVATDNDVANTNVTFTVRSIAPDVPIITSASDEASVDILELAGSSYVLRLEETIGESFAVRTLGGDTLSHVIGRFGELLIAEAATHGTPLVGETLRSSGLRSQAGVSVIGVWERGRFEPAHPDTEIRDNTILLLAGKKENLDRYDEQFRRYGASPEPVVILGGGRVGRATAEALSRRDIDYRIVELSPNRVLDPKKYIVGSAADIGTLELAGIRETATVIITPRDDDLNVYLTIYCRRLRPDIQILCRATNERNVATLHRAGADSVLSYASMGATAAMNLLRRSSILTVAEGLELFSIHVPTNLAGKTIAESNIREETGCSVVAVQSEPGAEVVPGPEHCLPLDAEILLVGSADAEGRFLKLYSQEMSGQG